MLELLQYLRNQVAIGFVGGSDLVKQQEQLGSTGRNGIIALKLMLTVVLDMFDYCFAENGLTAYRQGTRLASEVRDSGVIVNVDFYPLFR